MALGIPVKMVVLTIVGMAGLAAMLVIIDNGQSAVPKPIHANVKSSNLVILSSFNDTENIDMTVEVIDSMDGTHIRKASVALSGMGTIAAGMTDDKGYAVLRFKKTDFELKSGEGYLKLYVNANGFQDYSNEYAVKIVM